MKTCKLQQLIVIIKLMILDQSDPTGIGLFSKCARNHASKFKSQKAYVSSRAKQKKQNDQPTHKKMPAYFSFDKQESRQQRQKKYKNFDAPPVGHYHPTSNKKPKLVWDILKVYNHSAKPKITQSISQFTANKTQTHQKLVETIDNYDEIITDPIPSTNLITGQDNLHASSTVGDNSMSGILSKSQCMVNMSRMTGRKDIQIQSIDWGNVDIMRSVSKVKGHISKNIYFDKQLKDKPRRYGDLKYAASYDCNYEAIKPRKKGLLDFSNIKGRDQKLKTSHQYSYQHYNYNSYVWEKQSHVFPNTKTHLITFDRQTNRYAGFVRPENKSQRIQ